MSYDIKLPLGMVPTFPDSCINCGCEAPGAFLEYDTNAIGWWTIVFISFGKKHRILVPACSSCKRQLRRNRLLRLSLALVLLGIGSLLAIHLLHNYHGPFKTHIAILIALPFLAPYIAWELKYPPPFDLTAYSETIDYEFRDAGYASEFAMLNDASLSQ
jgi:hypothetical protein